MATGWQFNELYLWHDTLSFNQFFRPGLQIQPGEHAEHPETKRRMRNLIDVAGVLDELVSIRATPAPDTALLRFHTEHYLETLEALSAGEGGEVSPSTPMGPGSFDIARLAVGGAIASVDAVLDARVDNAYALLRPPGHHALSDQAMGFCLLGNAALAVHHARAARGVGRVAVVDWDVHHGNGTEAAFYRDPDVLTLSIHQDSLFPIASGAREDTGADAGVGANINVPLPAGSGGGAYLETLERVVLPALARHAPELIVVSCGFDASAMDPLGHMMLSSADFRAMTLRLLDVAAQVCDGRVVMLHEGGYSAPYVPYCGLAVVEALNGRQSSIEDPWLGDIPHYGGQAIMPHQRAVIDAVCAVHAL
ncbi:MAG: class II histone deacetylase [Pseudomonadota bacterium]